jgi:hypothetical protein
MKRWCWIMIAAAAPGLMGCEKALFPEDLPRTPYERYDRMRGRYVPPSQRDAVGGESPALRERLTPPPQ